MTCAKSIQMFMLFNQLFRSEECILLSVIGTSPHLRLPWKSRNPPFDIGSYGEQILDTLSSRTNNTGTASFSEIVSGRPKFEIARTFSALLQLPRVCYK
ncbi:condensin-2 complex subunit H2-like isoform X2 [Zea mays]|uniref:condensin-2 complex subunit H2-like isoform X2 n=1 Tax=Zea mays TaxID=4577 RepID=UPI0009A984F9|nr:condensin-2 complex subunit H2-like isoform X2 [Zea mays]|eukprot:XP_020395443.1 condensin-2 complex subunit H2-like isoform X2 [Zea mays]